MCDKKHKNFQKCSEFCGIKLVISRLGVRFLSPAPEIFAAKFCGVLIFPTAKKVDKKVLTTRI